MELIIGVIKVVMAAVGFLLAIGTAGIIGLAMLLIFGWIFSLFLED